MSEYLEEMIGMRHEEIRLLEEHLEHLERYVHLMRDQRDYWQRRFCQEHDLRIKEGGEE